ncbi:MAG: zinc-finger domain-containing protein [Rhodospirillales bacterium]|nr:zinc-finger domain-containing protein [Alphaproteobacteria bacterium]USO03956.1 MAG: zinc-finger domain-containing protein [Rhodospirillales bacterium]
MSKQTKEKQPAPVLVEKDTDEIMCDGGNGPFGHPQVWYGFNGQSEVQCGYCGQKFVKKTD